MVKGKKFRTVKPEIRVIGIDDGFFEPHTKGKCDVVGVVFRGGCWLDGVMRTSIEIDGMDATERIADMIMHSPHFGQLRIIMLDGVTFAGFNIVDTSALFETTKLPVIAITREKPNLGNIRHALENLTFAAERWKMINSEKKIVEVPVSEKKAIFMQVTGLEEEDAKRIVSLTSTRSNIPEALRVAHLIATGLTVPNRN